MTSIVGKTPAFGYRRRGFTSVKLGIEPAVSPSQNRGECTKFRAVLYVSGSISDAGISEATLSPVDKKCRFSSSAISRALVEQFSAKF